ncbi:RTX toxin [Rhizobium sp. L1K21]|uniref:RTX toxin n=1 Tax=Rhizobium sp. L1K21 TaxID=2954933 RepID=UPI0020920D9F|nr:RTX toxin [Rhizobium sp. L1K21]MCO6186531.1 RTX toxin [Rhizobium sp. L1K21]
MTSVNAFFSSAYARQYATQLFTKADAPSNAAASTGHFAYVDRSAEGYASATDRAMARIAEILNGLNDDGDDTGSPRVDETSGYITAATGTSGDDTLTFKSVGLYNVDAGDGDDTVTVKTGAISNLNGGAGSDKLNLTAETAMDVSGGDGDDVINFSGSFAKDFDGGAGDDTLRVNAKTVMGVTGGDGNDTIEVTGERISLSGGTGDDTITITNKGEKAAEYNYAAGDGSDKISTDGPLKINFTFGYTANDLTISTEGTTLTVKGANGDAIAVTLTNGSDPSAYEFGVEDGVLTLSIG